jgi:hypothetical protein
VLTAVLFACVVSSSASSSRVQWDCAFVNFSLTVLASRGRFPCGFSFSEIHTRLLPHENASCHSKNTLKYFLKPNKNFRQTCRYLRCTC